MSRLCIRWSKYWSFSFSISPLHEYSGLISFRTDHTLGSPRDSKESSPTPQFESINSFLFLSLSFLYGPTLTSTHDYWKNHSFDYTDLCWQTNVSGFLICCLGWSQLFFQGASILISWLQSPSAVILEPKKIKSITVSIVSPSICHEVMGPDVMIFVLNVEF